MDSNTVASQGRVDAIYSKVQSVYLKSKEKEERQRELRITIELHTGVGPLGRQVLGVQITDDEDPYFLCSLLVTEEDFKSLKVEQGLLVDFDHFPSQLVRLLEECVSGRDRIGSRFNLILNDDSVDLGLPRHHTNLQFVETNEFKHLCHLSLRVLPGSDNEIKKHMSMKLKKIKEDLSNTMNVLNQKTQMLSMAYEKLEAKNQELEELRNRLGHERSNLEQRVLQEAANAREALSKAHLEWQQRLEKERQESEEVRIRATRTLEEQLSEFKRSNQGLSEQLLHTESSVRELAKHVDSAERELKNAQREVATLRKQNAQIDMDYHEKEKNVNKLRTKLAVLEQEMKDKNLLLSKQQELLQVANQQKAQLEDNIAAKDAAIEQKNFTLNAMSADIAKANEIIAKQYNDCHSMKSKIKLRTDIAMKQEEKINVQEKLISDLRDKGKELENKVQELNNIIKENQLEIAKCKDELESKDKSIKNNENVITWLTRQVKEAQAGGSNFGVRNAYVPSLAASIGAPTTSTPNIAGKTPSPHFTGHSSVQETSAESFLQKQRENMRNVSELRQKLGLVDLQSSDKQKSPLVPVLEESGGSEPSKKSPLLNGSGDLARDLTKPRTRSTANIKPPKPARHTPTNTTPVVKRSDILSSYFPKS